MNFSLPQTNSVKYLREVAAALAAHGWNEATSLGQHFGNPDDRNFGTMRLYGECWTEVTDQLRSLRG